MLLVHNNLRCFTWRIRLRLISVTKTASFTAQQWCWNSANVTDCYVRYWYRYMYIHVMYRYRIDDSILVCKTFWKFVSCDRPSGYDICSDRVKLRIQLWVVKGVPKLGRIAFCLVFHYRYGTGTVSIHVHVHVSISISIPVVCGVCRHDDNHIYVSEHYRYVIDIDTGIYDLYR